MMNLGRAFISQFSTRIEDIPVIDVGGQYDYAKQKWTGVEISAMPDTKTKTEAPLNKDEEGDWNQKRIGILTLGNLSECIIYSDKLLETKGINPISKAKTICGYRRPAI